MKSLVQTGLIILIFISVGFSQEVSNIHFEQAGKQIHIYYDLQGNQVYTVQVFCSTDNGQTWGTPLKYVSGAVGENQKPKKGKMIVWEVLSEREDLSGKVLFKLEAVVSQIGFFKDTRDGKSYKWVRIGTKIWMAENLNYNNKGSYCYKREASNCDLFGRLYKWKSALSACPRGWHLPSDREWKQLERHIGMNPSQANLISWRGTTEGNKLKSSEGWFNDGNGEDNVSFSALPGGYYKHTDKQFDELNKDGNWWSSTGSNSKDAWARGLYFLYSKMRRHHGNKNDGFSVRCVRD